jgi:hypothetical protein
MLSLINFGYLVPDRKWPFLPTLKSYPTEKGLFCQFLRQFKILVLGILNVCLRLKFLLSLNLTKNSHFRSGTKSTHNFNPQNTQCMPAVKILSFPNIDSDLDKKFSFSFRHCLMRILLSALSVLFIFNSELQAKSSFSLSKEKTVLYSNLAGMAAITGWGVLNWDYFQTRPKAQRERWFQRDTKNGGADKLGHFYTSFAVTHAISSLYVHKGFSRNKGALLGALSTFAMTTWMEIGDSFSDYGFSYEDAVMNLLGSLTGYLFYIRPELAETLDIRFELGPHFRKVDAFTDYDNQKILIALKLGAFEFTKNSPLEYLELQLGYYARGYTTKEEKKKRNVFFSLGMNMPRIFNDFSLPRVSRAANYIQIPYTYVEKW